LGLHRHPVPANITLAVATSVSEIHLEWSYSQAGSVTFEVLRTKSGETTATSFPGLAGNSFDDKGLEESTSYLYQVIATEDGDEGPPSEVVAATTFGKAFDVVLTGDRQRNSRTIVQRIEPVRLFRGGSRVLITIQRSALGDLVINKLYVSKAADAAYMSAPDLTAVLEAPVAIPADPANGPFALPPIEYVLDNAAPLLLAFEIGSPGNVHERSPISATEATAFVSPINVFEASQPTRSPGYNVETRIYLVQRIDVA
jgi:hypothetical protein